MIYISIGLGLLLILAIDVLASLFLAGTIAQEDKDYGNQED